MNVEEAEQLLACVGDAYRHAVEERRRVIVQTANIVTRRRAAELLGLKAQSAVQKVINQAKVGGSSDG